MASSLNARRQTRGYAWLRRAKAAYRDRQYSGLMVYGIAGSLMTPGIVLRKLLERKTTEPLPVNSFKLGLNTEGQPFSSLKPNPIHEPVAKHVAPLEPSTTVQKGGREMAKQNEIDSIKTVAKVDHKALALVYEI